MARKPIPVLYHPTNKVRVLPYNTVATVCKVVEVGGSYLCPHCGYPTNLQSGAGSRFAYYLDIPHPNASCCVPLRHYDLRFHDEVNEHTLASYLQYLRKKSRRR